MEQQHIILTFFKEDMTEKDGQFQLPVYWWNALVRPEDRHPNNRKSRIVRIAAILYAETKSDLFDLANLFCDAKRKKEGIAEVFDDLKAISVAVPIDAEFDNFAAKLESLTSNFVFQNTTYGDHYPDFVYPK